MFAPLITVSWKVLTFFNPTFMVPICAIETNKKDLHPSFFNAAKVLALDISHHSQL